MYPGSLPFALPLLAIAGLTAGIAVYSFSHPRQPGANAFGWLTTAMTVWGVSYALEILAPTLPLKILAGKSAYLGIVTTPIFWLAFALEYTGHAGWLTRNKRLGLLGISTVTLGLVFTNESHKLIWNGTGLDPQGFPSLVISSHGLWFWVHTTISYGLVLAGIMLYLVAYARAHRIFRQQISIMVIASVIPLVMNAVTLFAPLPLHGFDLTPFTFALSSVFLAIGLFRFNLINLIPIADTLVIENLRDAVIVVDAHQRVVDLNSAARTWLNTGDDVIGRDARKELTLLEPIWQKWQEDAAPILLNYDEGQQRRWFNIAISPVRDLNKNLLGSVIIARDTSREQELLEAELHRSAQLGLLEEVGRQVAESFNEKEILQRSIDAVVNRFGYAEAAISLLTNDNLLEIAAISGTQDFGFRPGYKQEMGKGIIGHTAAIRKTYISKHVANDPYYFSNEEHHGSAICVPILNELGLIGVIYVESEEFHEFNQQDASTLETLAQQVSASLQRASLYSRSQDLLRIMSTVQAVSRVISSSLDLETIFESVVKELKKNFGYTHVSIYLLKEDYLHMGAQIGYPEETMFRKIHISQGVHGRTVKTRKVQFIQDVTKEPIYLPADYNISSEICVPLLKDNIVLGTINVEGSADSPLTQSDADMLTTLALPIALAVDNARLHTQVKEMAMTDAVSGLSNRHAFEEILNAEVERATRFGHHLSLIIFDLDSFKDYNDEWGHPAGDLRLKATADLVRNNLRKYDMAARYGGDEFAIILPNTDQSSALEFAKRLHHAAQASTSGAPIEEKSVAGYTISMGIATFPNDGNTLATLLHAADQAALRAKRLGKNQIYLANDQKNNGQA